MKREIRLEEISDGKRYLEHDLAKLGCNACSGCSDCCKNMGESIILDPYDIVQLSSVLIKSFEELYAMQYIELNVVDGIILPNLKMRQDNQSCGFLDAEGRCSVHANRPGVCRLFPLGRIYENNDFEYFLQIHECDKRNGSKVKISQWIGTTPIKLYHTYSKEWHYFLNAMEELVYEEKEEQTIQQLNKILLHKFFRTPYQRSDLEGFYQEFKERKDFICRELGIL